MSDLIAQGSQPRQRWRRSLSGDDLPAVVVGRVGTGRWEVPWDDRISRRHVTLTPLADGGVMVEKIATARNPVFFRGQRQDAFALRPGEHFVIGHTTFTLAIRPEVSEREPPAGLTEHLYDVAELRRRGFRDPPSRIDALSRLPDIIAGSTGEEEWLVRVVSLLLNSIPAASAVAVLDLGDPDATVTKPAEFGRPRVLHYDHRIADSQGPQPSGELARQAIATRQSVLHLWDRDDAEPPGSEPQPDYTSNEGIDWAFCVPLPTEACRGWAIYVTGMWTPKLEGEADQSRRTIPEDFRDDIKFTELVGAMLGNLRQARRLQRQQISMGRFFGPVVMEALASGDPQEVLRPRQTEVTVIFCDLREFSRQSERERDRLLDLLGRVSDSLGVMTGEILAQGGVIGDFHGDAAMGFWGWPLDQPDAVARACRAAVRIRDAFRGAQGRRRLGFRCGIGIATGQAVAGRIGTRDQVKVTALGPVVNLASRLEGLTKPLGTELLIDEASAKWLAREFSDRVRLRRVARVLPAGLSEPITVYDVQSAGGAFAATAGSGWIAPVLVRGDEPAEGNDAEENGGEGFRLSEPQVRAYEAAWDAFAGGDWEVAWEGLNQLPAEDPPTTFLRDWIRRHDRVAPQGWDGVIDLAKTGG
ncbi:MAG: adenylate/guanylate cyclase domain-containing protein [Planctomycetaceae bacterium]|nr:MAG: adenylate/guanylate cyclase domain-containing protein [Planctomycetaceae bacterium]